MKYEYPKKLSEVAGRDLIQVFTDQEDGERYVWFLGYGRRDRSVSSGFSWLHFTHNVIPLKTVLAHPLLNGMDFNRTCNYDKWVDVEPLDVYTLKYYYSDADTEEPTPYFQYRDDIEDGYYIMKGAGA